MTHRLLFAAAVCAAVIGCGPATRTSSTQKGSDTSGQKKPDVFEKPNPSVVGDDPRVIALQATTERTTALLVTVRKRLDDLKTRMESKPATEKDLAAVAEALKPLATHAREDCDAVLRAAKDLRFELGTAAKGYHTTADLYRERAASLKDPDLKAIQLKMADEFDRLAADVPRRIAASDAFIAELVPMQEFLAEAERCLSDTRTALAILTAGSEPVKASNEGKVFRLQLERFVKVLEDYQGQLLPWPGGKKPVKPATPDCPTTDPPEGARVVTDPAAPSVIIYRRHYCERCQAYHWREFRVAPDYPGYDQLPVYKPEGQ